MPKGKTFRESLTPEQLKKLDAGDDSLFEGLTSEQQALLDREFEQAMTPGQKEALARLQRGAEGKKGV